VLVTEWSYFPEDGDLCLIGVRGFQWNGGSGADREYIAFTLCENFGVYRELRHFQPVPTRKAKAYRARLIAELSQVKPFPSPHRVFTRTRAA
jgi:hypothetical protein